MPHRKTFLGVGWKFPPTFDIRSKSVEMVSEEADIKESLFILLSTRPGERIMLPEYGCDVNALIFESIDAVNINYLKKMMSKAIRYFEPRIELDNIDVSADQSLEGKLLVDIQYRVRTTNARSNMVYPYYILEGTEVRNKLS